jgi:hypothetical protein
MLVLGGCAGGLSGCSRDGSSGAAGAAATSRLPSAGSSEDTEHYRQFAKCMREHGVQVADPGAHGGFTMPSPLDNDPGLGEALGSCRQLLPGGGQPRVLSPEELEASLRISQCMREHGVNMPDPDSHGQIRIDQSDGIDDQAMQDAAKACEAATPDGDR